MKGLPIGIENFKKLIDKNVYYVDKSKLIEDLINEEVILYTRPRRFGKTLNMSMLYYFFSILAKKENCTKVSAIILKLSIFLALKRFEKSKAFHYFLLIFIETVSDEPTNLFITVKSFSVFS